MVLTSVKHTGMRSQLLFSFADQNSSLFKNPSLNLLFAACTDLHGEPWPFSRELTTLQMAELWQNEAPYQVCAGPDMHRVSQSGVGWGSM